MSDDDAEFTAIAREAFRRRIDWKAARKPGDEHDSARNGLEWWVYVVTKEKVNGSQ